MHPEIEAYLAERAFEAGRIGPDRRALLDRLGAFVRSRGGGAQVVFVCTHNSRRSQLAQVWAAAAAHRHGVALASYSGGTEATAFHPAAVEALRRAGVRLEPRAGSGGNPVYVADLGPESRLECFSKVYDQPPNPRDGFGAVMVCTDADEACPSVPGAAFRLGLPFEDPKVSDGTAAQGATYDERCAQIAREMLYAMARAAE